MKVVKVIFVCTGNTCRSPMAEAILKSTLPEIEVLSRGICAVNGMKINHLAGKVIKTKLGRDFKHSAKNVSEEEALGALVLTMEKRHRDFLRAFSAMSDVYTLREYAGEEDSDIGDPIGGDIDVYTSTFEEIEGLIGKVIKKLGYK